MFSALYMYMCIDLQRYTVLAQFSLNTQLKILTHLFCRHCIFEHVQTNGTHQFTVEAARWNWNLCSISDGFLRCAMEFIQA